MSSGETTRIPPASEMTDVGRGGEPEAWEQELGAMHRWGRFKFWFGEDEPGLPSELGRLQGLRQAAGPLDASLQRLVGQLCSLEICNWRLEEGILALCGAIGRKHPLEKEVGHLSSMTPERWRIIWAYYLSLRSWLPGKADDSLAVVLAAADPDRNVRSLVLQQLGEKDELKELYVERFSLTLLRWLHEYRPDTIPVKALQAAVAVLDAEIARRDPEHEVLPEVVLQNDGDGRLNQCNHKLFRHYDLIISSIGARKWRAVMGRRGTDGFERAALLEQYLAPIQAWVEGQDRLHDGLGPEIARRLGPRDDTKVFLAALLVSLLRGQQLAARSLAARRGAEKQ